jgi:integrase
MSIYVFRNTLFINFVYQGIRCRESLRLKNTKQNRVLAKRIDQEIHGLISAGKFNYAEYFPNSSKLKLFNQIPAKEKNIKFADYANKWIQRKNDEYDANQLKFSTLKSYQQGVNRILTRAKFSKKYLNDITVTEIKSFIILLCKDLNPKTVVNTLTPLRQIFQDAYFDGIIEDNPMLKIKNPKLIKPEIYPFTKDEIGKILNYFESEYNNMYAFIAVMVFTGMRVGEVLAMKWKNFDFDKWTYHVKDNFSVSKLTSPKTEKSIRKINITTTLQKAILCHKKYSFMKSDFVFLNYYNKPFVSSEHIVKRYWKPALKELGIEYRPLKQLRHTHAILSLIAGDNPHDIAKRLGHTSLQMLFNKYAKFLKAETEPSKLEKFLSFSTDYNNKNVNISSTSKS